MPSTYAHYRYGVQLLPNLPADIRRTIGRFRRMYDVGLHGPDIFFYYLPITSTGYDLGHKYHFQSGRDFFQRVCRMTRLDGSESARAYLYGLLGHYALDSACHSFIREQSQSDPTAHVRMEAEFDRYLLEKDGKIPACSQDLSPHIQLSPGECETVAKFYPGATAPEVRGGVRGMAFITRLLSLPEGKRRSLLQGGARLLSKKMSGMIIPTQPDPTCACYDEELMALYENAVTAYPLLLTQIQASLTYNAALDEAFTPPFG